MDKYNFGYVLEQGTTNLWAYNLINDSSKVLEIGPAIGNLTYHLSTQKKCIVDIVEIDEESGKKASVFARNALLGTLNGNLNEILWYEKLNGEKYDYIVAIDVLEHLIDPEHVLELLKSLLADNGQIILSIPNVTHNAVIAAMIDNRFEYTELGLLDKTHIHFFSYYSILTMINNVKMKICSIDAIKKVPIDTEVINHFDDLPKEVNYYLRKRTYADVYQYLIVIGKEDCTTKNYLQEGHHEESFYQTKILVNGLSKNTICLKSFLDNIKIHIDLDCYENVSSLRFIPDEEACLVTNLKAYVIDNKNQKNEIFLNWTTGVIVDDTTLVLSDDNHEINFLISSNVKSFELSCDCLPLSTSITSAFFRYEVGKKQADDNLKKLEIEYNSIQKILADKDIKYEELNTILEKNKIHINELELEKQSNLQSINEQIKEISRLKQEIEFLNKHVIAIMREDLETNCSELNNLKLVTIPQLNQELSAKKCECTELKELNNKYYEELTTIKSHWLYKFFAKILRKL